MQRLEIGLVVVVDLELPDLDEAELHAGLDRFDRPDVRLVPVLDQKLFLRRVGDVRLDRRQVEELPLGKQRRHPGLGRLPEVVGAVGERLANEVAVDVPAAIEPPLRRDVTVRGEHPRLVAVVLELLGDEGDGGRELRFVRGRLVHRRVDARQQRRVRRQRPGPLHRRPGEAGGVGGEGVVVRRQHARLRVVAVHLVGAEGVDHPDVDVIEAGLGRRRLRVQRRAHHHARRSPGGGATAGDEVDARRVPGGLAAVEPQIAPAPCDGTFVQRPRRSSVDGDADQRRAARRTSFAADPDRQLRPDRQLNVVRDPRPVAARDQRTAGDAADGHVARLCDGQIGGHRPQRRRAERDLLDGGGRALGAGDVRGALEGQPHAVVAGVKQVSGDRDVVALLGRRDVDRPGRLLVDEDRDLLCGGERAHREGERAAAGGRPPLRRRRRRPAGTPSPTRR